MDYGIGYSSEPVATWHQNSNRTRGVAVADSVSKPDNISKDCQNTRPTCSGTVVPASSSEGAASGRDTQGFSSISQIIHKKEGKIGQTSGNGIYNGVDLRTDKVTFSEAVAKDSSHHGKQSDCVKNSHVHNRTAYNSHPQDEVVSTSRDAFSEAHVLEPATQSEEAVVPGVGAITASTSKITATSLLPTLNLNLNLPPVTQTVTHGFGVKMVATSSSQQLIYRSVPPRPLSYTLTDVLESQGAKHRSKTAPVSTNSPEEYAMRFKSRPITKPKVIEFDGSTVSSKNRKSMPTIGFPHARAKIYLGHPKSRSPVESLEVLSPARSPVSKLQLQPLGQTNHPVHPSRKTPTTPGQMTTRTQRSDTKTPATGSAHHHGHSHSNRGLTKSAASSSAPGHPTKSTTSTLKHTDVLQETSQSVDLTTTIPQDLVFEDPDDHIHNPDLFMTSSTDCDDISVLPRPKKVLPKRELPWVFRYKVKRGMNALSKIMASKPQQGLAHSSHALT